MLFRSPWFHGLRGVPITLATLAAGLALGVSGCNEETDTTTDTETSSLLSIYVQPSLFIGDVPCSSAPGAMRSYVATLVDRTNPEVPFTLPSSLPTPCSMGVRFNDVVAGHRYTAEIDGYEAFADEICPEGCFLPNGTKDYKVLRSGSRHMAHADGSAAEPRWLATCGSVDGDSGSGGSGGDDQPYTIAADTGTTVLAACSPLVDQGAATDQTGVEIGPQDTLGALACADDGVSGVAEFDIEAAGALPDLLGIPCTDAPFVQKYQGAGLVPGALASFFVAAHQKKGGPITWGAVCSAVVEKGLTVRAACTPLSAKGSLHIDIAGVLGAFGVSCSGDVVSYDATVTGPGGTIEKTDVSCTGSPSFGPLDPGDYTTQLVIRTADGKDLFSATCFATVQPGRVTTGDCTIQ